MDSVKMEEVDDESVADFVTANIINHDSTVTCGSCKEQMLYQEYDSNHRNIHYNLCWIDGVEDEIDFSNTSNTQSILRKFMIKCKTKLEFKCVWCDQIKLSVVGFSNHLKKCNKSLQTDLDSSRNDDYMPQINSKTSNNSFDDGNIVSCGRCGVNMTYSEYKTEHVHVHYNLCWIEGEEKLDFKNDKVVAGLLRDILPKNAVRDKKVSFTCEWCSVVKRSVLGYASHVKTCVVNQKLVEDDDKESLITTINEVLPLEGGDNTVVCGRCNESMLLKDYEIQHKLIHYNLCWLIDGEKPDFDDDSVVQSLLRKCLPKNAARKKKVIFNCEWCHISKKSVPGFASHFKQCQSRPDKIISFNEDEDGMAMKSCIEMAKQKDASMVTCGRCNKEMTFKEYRDKHCFKHFNLCWIVGEDKLDLANYETVLAKLKQFVPFKAVRNRSVKLVCEDCNSVKKSLSGFASHVVFCNKTACDIELLLVTCEHCGCKVKPSSLINHRLKSCMGLKISNSTNESVSKDNSVKLESPIYSLRRKKRPPNVLSFHPDTKHVTEYYDLICRLCNFSTLGVNSIINHISKVHNIEIETIKSKKKLEDYILNKYDVHRNIYLRPLLNYYNFFKKTFWKEAFHVDFQPDVVQLECDEALKYLPSVQQSCKIFSSNKELINVDLFKSAFVNGMYWMFTGGPIWAMSWCPVPEEIKIQYLAISCHPKPDLVHKEMEIYKYPSLVQIWTYSSLNNINYEQVIDMPCMSYGLAHEFGAVWDMAWCPSGAYEPKLKIGLLALSTSCGDCPVFAMPPVDGKSEMFYIYKAKSMIARNFECERIEGVQCTRVCWQPVSPFKTLICGYSNGMVCVFNINSKSIFLNDVILYPSHIFRASRCSITGLSVNCLNASILATTATDGIINLWDLKATENPVFQKKSYSPSDCTWLQQCHTLVHCSKGVNPLFLKVRTVNFSNCDDDVDGYNPDLYVINNVSNSCKVIKDCNFVSNDTSNSDMDSSKYADRTVNKNKSKVDDEHLDDSFVNSGDESSKSFESNENSDQNKSNNVTKPGDPSKTIEEEDYYGPAFFQRCTHWSVAGSNWMNVIATGDESGIIYEKLFVPETNQLKKGNSTILQLMVTKLSTNDTIESEFLKGYRFKETVNEFALHSRLLTNDESIEFDPNDTKPLLRYPLDNITKVSWNQNFYSFRWLAIGTQSGFTLVSPSQAISDSCFELFYKTILTINGNNLDTKTADQTRTQIQTDISI